MCRGWAGWLRDVRNGFSLPPEVRAANFTVDPASEAHRAVSGASALASHTSTAFAPSLSWADVQELRSRTKLPLIVKGILDPEDAVRAAECGADAVVVSNHGGRQLDGAIPAVDALEAVCAAIDGRVEVLVDSGFRSGVDVLKALALGASGVLVAYCCCGGSRRAARPGRARSWVCWRRNCVTPSVWRDART